MSEEKINSKIELSPKNMLVAIQQVLEAKLVPYIIGSPGVGKSDLIRVIAKNNNLKVIDIRLAGADPTDMSGLITIDQKKNKAAYMPLDQFPIEGDVIPSGYNGWLINLDELPSAVPAVIKAAYKLILDREVGLNKLHSKVVLVAAGNLVTDGAMVGRLPTAMMSRMITLRLRSDPKDFIEHAIASGFNHRVISFTSANPGKIHAFNPKEIQESGADSFGCPRTYEFLSKLMNKKVGEKFTEIDKAIFSGTIGQKLMYDFVTYCNVYQYLPSLTDIVNNPTGCNLPDDRGHQFALCGMLRSEIRKENAMQILHYTMRMSIEFQMLTIQAAVDRDATLIQVDQIREWISEVSKPIL
jgi:hypothetical protein